MGGAGSAPVVCARTGAVTGQVPSTLGQAGNGTLPHVSRVSRMDIGFRPYLGLTVLWCQVRDGYAEHTDEDVPDHPERRQGERERDD